MNRKRLALFVWLGAVLWIQAVIGANAYWHTVSQIVTSGVTPCAGTVIHFTAPDDLSNAAWNKNNSTALANAITAPDGNMTASTDTATAGTFTGVSQATTLSSGVTSSISAYFKTLVSPTWISFGISDNVANAFSSWFNLSGSGAVGTANIAGDGTLSCATVTAVGNGWIFISLAGAYATGRATFLNLILVDADNSTNATIGQSLGAWHVGQ